MNIRDIYSAQAIASVYTEVASGKTPYLGTALFPAKKKMGLDLKFIRGSKGLPVSLMPSAFDTKSTIRSRDGFKVTETQMPYFKESMLVKEEDEQEIMRVQDANDPYAKDVLGRIFDDSNALIDGANVVPERMIWQLLANENGKPSISIAGDGATYSYDFDADGKYAAENFLKISGTTDKWDNADSDPLKDVQTAQDAVEDKTGVRPSLLVISKKTMNYLKTNNKVKNYILAQNVTANVMITDARVKELFATELGIALVVYTKKYKDESGVAQTFYPDGMATLLPSGALGNTWYGTTPDERTLLGDANFDCKIVNTGVAVTVTTTNDPVHTKTTASEIVLPSFERMDETYQIKCY